MLNKINYIKIVRKFFSFLENEYFLNQIKEVKNGNVFYEVEYKNMILAVSISYEVVGEYLEVIIFKLNEGRLPDYDDKTQTLHLSKLNKRLLPQISSSEILENNLFFKDMVVSSIIEKNLLKKAKELRLILNRLEWGNVSSAT